jgi:hypothetical protein
MYKVKDLMTFTLGSTYKYVSIAKFCGVHILRNLPLLAYSFRNVMLCNMLILVINYAEKTQCIIF